MKNTRLSYAQYLAACLMVLSLIVGIISDDDLIISNILWVVMLTALATVALHILSLSGSPVIATSPVLSTAEKDVVILILGPYASKWFGQSETTKQVRYSDSMAWILIRTPQELEAKLEYFQEQAPQTQLRALFPFLPDGHDNTSLMLDQLTIWHQRSASKISLPCTFVLYSRLSEHNTGANRVNWSGEMDLANTKRVSFLDALSSLESTLVPQPGNTQDEIQRIIFTHQLIVWLKESQLASHFEQLFSHSIFSLTTILLCDYSKGFTRHGAWARWTEEQFAVLPALGSNAAPLPCAPVKMSVPGKRSTDDVIISVNHNYPRLLWSVVLVTLVLTLHLLYTTYWLEQQQQAYGDVSTTFRSEQQRSLTQLNHNLNTLQQLRGQFSRCADYHAIGFWGFPACTHQLQVIDKTFTRLRALPTLTTARQSVLFASGSAVINPSAGPALEQIKILASRFPKHSLLIVGHTDNSGSEEINTSLSHQRAAAVRDWLISHNTPAPERFVTHGVGATEPVASNQTLSGREQNRRIEILVLPLSQPPETFE
ncbi:OmpA family protein [Enterobacteriaceae bacterium 4M9]|nr:OmpA family protein [Enterobacteriaceae bacterium 4M9]